MWFKVDDGFYDHPKVVALRQHRNWRQAIALWTMSGAWLARHLSGTRVPLAVVSTLGFSRNDAESLVSAGLWEAIDGGYDVHDWHEYNPTKKQVETRRLATQKRVQKHRSSNAVTNTYQQNSVTPSPTRPDPTRPRSSLTGGDARKRVTPSSGDHAAFIAYFDEAYGRIFGAKPTWDGKRGAMVKRLLKPHGLAECIRRANVMFQFHAQGIWPCEQSADLATLSQHFDRFAQAPRANLAPNTQRAVSGVSDFLNDEGGRNAGK